MQKHYFEETCKDTESAGKHIDVYLPVTTICWLLYACNVLPEDKVEQRL